jgi:hypothetical protein
MGPYYNKILVYFFVFRNPLIERNRPRVRFLYCSREESPSRQLLVKLRSGLPRARQPSGFDSCSWISKLKRINK